MHVGVAAHAARAGVAVDVGAGGSDAWQHAQHSVGRDQTQPYQQKQGHSMDADDRRDQRHPAASARRPPRRTAVPLILLAAALITASQIDAFASFAAAFWISGLLLQIAALVSLWRNRQRGPRVIR